MENTVEKLWGEINHSMEKHGVWDDYSVKYMFDMIEAEFKEVLEAFFQNDHSTEHRLSRELLQVAVCCIKMSDQITKRYEK